MLTEKLSPLVAEIAASPKSCLTRWVEQALGVERVSGVEQASCLLQCSEGLSQHWRCVTGRAIPTLATRRKIKASPSLTHPTRLTADR
ncbi:hypothetical protein [Moorena sp. SIO4A5]|uniref:hypothetical protein n=1 Tax=Moorena sp. SIO4A5 TaxID=2607838 RepID=UPI0013C8103A|nr:hypothetical protein [Moorena sp. SIO4A5]NEO18509.1 hypothetical protein [Moorena sp. SIO4A5]